MEKAKDEGWVKLQVDKFGMYMTVLRVGEEGLESALKAVKEGRTDREEAEKLLLANKDAVSAWLDKTVSSWRKL